MPSWMVAKLAKTRAIIIRILINNKTAATMARHHSVRWAFNASSWMPTEADIALAATCIQADEKSRIAKFVFQDDAKSSLIGRLMMRKYAHLATSMPYEAIRFDRDSRGKPVLSGGDLLPTTVHFNVSHQGDFVVLAGEGSEVGIDVMKTEPPANKNISEFFRIMKRQFSQHEWAAIMSYATEAEQTAAFYRFWCLKESYVKNIGVGITVNLAEISFKIKSRHLKVGDICMDTVLFVKGVELAGWVFEETLLDGNHAVVVALQTASSHRQPAHYSHLTFEELVKEAKPFNGADKIFTDSFLKKELKTF